jgi:hypothetical protein
MQRHLAGAGRHMLGEETRVLGFKDVEGRAGPRIDFQQPEAFAFDEEVGAVQADERRRGNDLLDGCGEFVRCS